MADDGPAYRPRKPSSAPSEGSLAERDAFTALARQSLTEVRASAEAWRNGLTAFLTLVTTGIIIKGRDTIEGLSTAGRALVTVLIVGAVALAMAGLWRVLAAQAGTRYRLSARQDIQRAYGTIEAYQLAVADRATDDLDVGRRLVVAALAMLLIGIGVSWWAPTTQSNQSTQLKITFLNASVCGALHSVDNGQIRLTVRGKREPITIPLALITGFTVVATCD